MALVEVYRSPPFNLEGYIAFKVRYSNGRKRTVLEHREVLEKKLGRRLRSNEIVHHKNEIKTDNDETNLEIKTRSGHGKHHAKEPERITIICLWCKNPATVLARYVRHNQGNQKKAGPFCGKSCAGSWTRAQQLSVGMYNLRG